ncbi:DUF4142 domain-containing protein [Nitrospirillum pindoramense]|uniref:Putative membrane protein n=1 Tax=Nitrospirillum amazonense TaxID=28077 RepID=A0A560HAV6_9PROT|nr:DUF4142 domain-containing protein [Nitrospirillum amazonense]TWB43467.1 putative membrane protein [Nitrospirillum amazonense]
MRTLTGKAATASALCLMLFAPALATPAAAQDSVGDKAKSMGEKTGANSVLGVTPRTEDFVKEVAISDMFEIQSSELAQQKGDEATKSFANQMIQAHQKTSAELKTIVTGGTVQATIPTALDNTHQKKLDKLKGLSGADFVKQYREDQVSAHKDADSAFERYAKGGDNPALKDWAAKTEPTIAHHLEMAKALDKTK